MCDHFRVPRLFRLSAALAVLALSAAAWVAAPSRAADAAPAVDYVRDVKPIFQRHCYECHGPKKQTHNMRMDQRAWVLAGGDSGEPTVTPGDAAGSHLIERLTSKDLKFRMPHDAEPLTAAEIDTVRRWIAAGALMPGDDTLKLEVKTDHWSFQPVRDVQAPRVDAAIANPIDAFVIEKLNEAGLSLSPEADRRTLIRRLYMVMHGLPPTPAQIDAFENDTAADAYDKLVDAVLASPRYGERWAQHWLDVVRYADTNGFETNTPRPNAYHYRDWVIAALNDDKPYDRFLFEQLAGDTVGEDVATGYIVAGPYDVVKGQDPKLGVMQRDAELHDMVSTTGGAMLGLTVGCAQCHNHKFDPVSQVDYYRMRAVFAGVTHGDRAIAETEEQKRQRLERSEPLTAQIAELERRIDELGGREAAVNAIRNVERFDPVLADAVRFTIHATNSGSQPCIDELEAWTSVDQGAEAASVNVALASAGAKPSASDLLPGYPIHQIEHLNDGLPGNNNSWISNTAGGGWAMVEFARPARIERVVWGRDRAQTFTDRVATSYVVEVRTPDGQWIPVASSPDREPGRRVPNQPEENRQEVAKLSEQVDRLINQRNALQKREVAYAGNFVNPPMVHRNYRGDPFSPREEVAPGVIEVLGDVGLTSKASNADRRVAFAEWVIDPKNPLTARVMVNRIWQHHFGTGIVDTPSDFGGNGTAPTHPDLLDWLAAEFVRSGWSIKHMHRLILHSRTFRQADTPRPDALAVDGTTRLLWRFPPRRLEAEAIRDSMLLTAGQLDLTTGGPGFNLFEDNANYVRVYEPRTQWGPAQFRRMVYVYKVRMEGGPVFGAFDCPDAGQPQPKRTRSTTAIQALNLFNSTFTMTLAEDLAERAQQEAGDDPAAQLDRMCRLTLGRAATPRDLAILLPIHTEHGPTAAARVLYNANEFLFIP